MAAGTEQVVEQSVTHQLELLIDTDSSALANLRDRLRRWLTIHGEPADDWLLVANELCTNAMAVASVPIVLRVSLNGTEVVLEVSDDGPGFDLEIVHPSTSSARRRGLWIVGQLTTSLAVARTGGRTTVIATRRRES